MLAKSGSSGPGKKKEDTFGMKDEDWDIYKAVSKVSGWNYRCMITSKDSSFN
jgi:hypothetical protein